MTTSFAMERLLLQDGVPPLHTATRPPQLNPTVTGPQSRCDPCNPTDDDNQAETDSEIIEVGPDTDDDSENDEMPDASSIFSDIEDMERPNPYRFYVLPLMEEEDDLDDMFLLVIPYRRDGQHPSLSLLLDEDQVYLGTPDNPDPYDYADQDDMYSTESSDSDSVPSSMVNSAIIYPYDFAAHWEGLGGSTRWPMLMPLSMSSSSSSSSGMNCSGWSGSASIYLMYAGTHLNDMVGGYGYCFLEALAVV
ncbi:hypothetical protein EMCG_02671 [[Emmonsia] crescens]|uniref:Uncharacterized protein n=1 Tax=[Emmonsia] crescens TaxID=73230 RepID=A0A0G2J8W9_9EURO|nr:hypothetical protein EMCG_02671 [Emmonsia crescens UAMH 3008]